MKALAAIFAGLVAAASVLAGEVVVYPAPAGIASNDRFTVKVRPPGGEWREVFCYQVEVDMHHPRPSSVAIFDFSGPVEIAVTSNRAAVQSARVRPLALGIAPKVDGNTLTFTLAEPRNLSVEVNGDIFGNLQLFAGPIEAARPDPKSPDVMYFGPGVHSPGPEVRVPSGKTVYLAGGAVVKTKLVCDRVENVRILGRGVLYQGHRGVEITHSKNIEIDGITVVNPRHYTVYGGASRDIRIRNLKAFSSRGWSDGIDLMSCSDVRIEGVFLRNSDDCIAIYAHRWDYWGDVRNITVRNSTLWADVAHPVTMGLHGYPPAPETIENLTFSNLDILDHDEPQLDYQGCFAINVSDGNLVRNVLVENLRVEDFERGQLVNLRVAFNRKFATAPGRGIENVTFRNVTYTGSRANISILAGYDTARAISGVSFENLVINGRPIRSADAARIFVGEHVRGVTFR